MADKAALIKALAAGSTGRPYGRLSDVPQVAGGPNTLAPYTPGPIDRVRNALTDMGAPRRTAEGVANVLDWLPGVGDAEGMYQAGREGAAGNVLGAAIIGGATLAGVPAGKARALLPSEQQAQSILDLLKSGRASEVKDDMLGKLDANGQAYLFDNYDLPMDAASREARAGDMGFDTGTPLYHGTSADFAAHDRSLSGTGAIRGSKIAHAGVFTSQNPRMAARYAEGGAGYGKYAEGGNIQKINAPSQTDFLEGFGGESDEASVRGFMDKSSGGNKVVGFGPNPNSEPWETVVFDPADIRSTNARFDPRLKHLRDLLAGVGVAGGAGLMGATNALMPQKPESY